MTTILGIKTSNDEEGIVIAADTQINIYEENKQTGKLSGSKIKTEKNYAFAYTGHYTKSVEAFFSYLSGGRDFESFIKFITGKKEPEELKGLFGFVPKNIRKAFEEVLKGGDSKSELEKNLLKIYKNEIAPSTEVDNFIFKFIKYIEEQTNPIETAIKRGYFEEIVFTNRHISKKRDDEDDDLGGDSLELILASNNPLIGLYHINQFGNVCEIKDKDDFDFVSLGSGSKAAKKYIENEEYKDDKWVSEKIDLDNIRIHHAIMLAIGAIKEASKKDVNTGGYIDLAVVKNNSIAHYGKFIQSTIDDAEKEAYKQVIEKVQQTNK